MPETEIHFENDFPIEPGKVQGFLVITLQKLLRAFPVYMNFQSSLVHVFVFLFLYRMQDSTVTLRERDSMVLRSRLEICCLDGDNTVELCWKLFEADPTTSRWSWSFAGWSLLEKDAESFQRIISQIFPNHKSSNDMFICHLSLITYHKVHVSYIIYHILMKHTTEPSIWIILYRSTWHLLQRRLHVALSAVHVPARKSWEDAQSRYPVQGKWVW